MAEPAEARAPAHLGLGLNRSEPGSRFELLVFTEAGKPVYSYSKRADAVTLMPLCSALLDYAKKAQGECLRTIRTGDGLVIYFSSRPPLITIVICEAHSYVEPHILVEQTEAQIVCILTAKVLRSVFDNRPTFDLKRLLYGSDKLIDAMTNLTVVPVRLEWPWVQAFLSAASPAPSAAIGSSANPGSADTSVHTSVVGSTSGLPARLHRALVPVAIVAQSGREAIHSAILSAVNATGSKNMVFSLLFEVAPGVAASAATDNNTEPVTSAMNSNTSTEIPGASMATSAQESTDITTEEHQDSLGPMTDIAQEQDASQNSTGTNSPPASSTESMAGSSAAGTVDDIKFKLMTVCNHHNRYKLKVADMQLVLALLIGSRAQLSSVESLWMPVCLTRFNPDAYLHSYISYICNFHYCLVMLSVDRDEFANCQQARDTIEEKLGALLRESNQRDKIIDYTLSPLVDPVLLELQDKLVNSSGEFTAEQLSEAKQQAGIYNSKLELYHARQLQFLWYQTRKQVLWWQRSDLRRPSRTLYYAQRKMLDGSLKTLWLRLADESVLLGWHVATFELYAQFDSTITTNEATEVVQRVTSWIRKEEDNFSIKDYR